MAGNTAVEVPRPEETPEATWQPHAHHQIIRPRRGLSILEFRDLLHHRELIWRFSRRDITLRYRQTSLGVLWVVILPLLSAGIFTFVFSKVAKLTAGVNYFVFSLSGMLIWNAFSNTISRASTSITGNSNIITKVFFPRLLLPLSVTTAALIDTAVGWALIVVLIPLFNVGFHWAMFTFPVWLLLTLLLAQGVGLMTSALTVRYRDVQFILPVLIQFGLYASPIAYPLSDVPHKLRIVDTINPLTGILQGARWSLIGHTTLDPWLLVYAIGATLIIFLLGAAVFERFERMFSDVV